MKAPLPEAPVFDAWALYEGCHPCGEVPCISARRLMHFLRSPGTETPDIHSVSSSKGQEAATLKMEGPDGHWTEYRLTKREIDEGDLLAEPFTKGEKQMLREAFRTAWSVGKDLKRAKPKLLIDLFDLRAL